MIYQAVDELVAVLPTSWHRVTKQFIKFGVTGAIGAVVDFSTYYLITRVFNYNNFYVVLGQKIIVANNISVFLAIISNFLLNKYWTFRDTNTAVMRQWASYFTLNAFTWVLNQLLVSVLAFEVIIIGQVFGSAKDIAAKVLAIGIILFINFAGSKFIIFTKPVKNLR